MFICFFFWHDTYNCNYFAVGEMREILVDAKEVLVEWQKYPPPKKQKWAERQTALAESWSESRAIICKAILQSTFAIPEDNMCCRC